MADALVEKMRRAREQNVTVNGHTFTIRRPTDGELAGMDNTRTLDFCLRFVVGWDLKEIDLAPGETPVSAEFTPLRWSEWINDHSEYWEPLATPMLAAYRRHKGQVEEAEKN